MVSDVSSLANVAGENAAAGRGDLTITLHPCRRGSDSYRNQEEWMRDDRYPTREVNHQCG
jgi:hypothetical protein